tara:strand:- start:686 stop:904 length:219 start_codon:yes stop_codon:yes gene_type:complete
MLHKISELCKKIDTIKEMSDRLYKEKYGSVQYNRSTVDHLIEQIQALAGDIYNDRNVHPKIKEQQSKGEVDD